MNFDLIGASVGDYVCMNGMCVGTPLLSILETKQSDGCHECNTHCYEISLLLSPLLSSSLSPLSPLLTTVIIHSDVVRGFSVENEREKGENQLL